MKNIEIAGGYDPHTFVAVRRGFLPWPDVRKDDEFLIRSFDGQMGYRRAIRIIRNRYIGLMHRYRGRSIDLLVTPNHKMLTRRHHCTDLQLISSKDMTYRNYHLPNKSKWCVETSATIDVNGCELDMLAWARFLYIAEGCVNHTGRGYCISVKQFKSPKFIANVKHVVSGLDVGRYREHNIVSSSEGLLCVLQHKALHAYLKKLGYSYELRIPREAMEWGFDALSALMYGLMLGDGHSGAQKQYFTSSPGLAHDVAELMVKLGRIATISVRMRDEEFEIRGKLVKAKYPSFTISRRESNETKLDCKNMQSVTYYDGMVYCADVSPHHALLVLRNGKLMWSGNSGAAIAQSKMYSKPSQSKKFDIIDEIYSDAVEQFHNIEDQSHTQ